MYPRQCERGHARSTCYDISGSTERTITRTRFRRPDRGRKLSGIANGKIRSLPGPPRRRRAGRINREVSMLARTACLFAAVLLPLLSYNATSSQAQTAAPAALTGKVSSAEEGAMEGVVVRAKKGIVTISVVSNAKGEFNFPTAKLEPGTYALSIRATGYDLTGPSTVTLAGARSTSTSSSPRPRILRHSSPIWSGSSASRAPSGRRPSCRAASIATRSSASLTASTTPPPGKMSLPGWRPIPTTASI